MRPRTVSSTVSFGAPVEENTAKNAPPGARMTRAGGPPGTLKATLRWWRLSSPVATTTPGPGRCRRSADRPPSSYASGRSPQPDVWTGPVAAGSQESRNGVGSIVVGASRNEPQDGS